MWQCGRSWSLTIGVQTRLLKVNRKRAYLVKSPHNLIITLLCNFSPKNHFLSWSLLQNFFRKSVLWMNKCNDACVDCTLSVILRSARTSWNTLVRPFVRPHGKHHRTTAKPLNHIFSESWYHPPSTDPPTTHLSNDAHDGRGCFGQG